MYITKIYIIIMNCNIHSIKKYFLHIITNVCKYDDFDEKLKELNTENKGYLFELFFKLYFTLIPTYKSIYDKIYLYKEIPYDIMKKLILPNKDKGIDGLIITINEEYLVVQVKYRKNKKPITFSELATFPALAFGTKCININGGILFTNSYDVCDELKNEKYNNITYTCFNKCDNEFWNICREYLRHDIIINYTSLTPLPHHQILLPNIEKYFKENNYGRI